MLNKYLITLLSASVVLLSACGGSSDNEGETITTDPNVCAVQSAKNEALWNYLKDDYFWNEQLDLSTDPTQFSSFSDLFADVRSKIELDKFSFAITEQEYQDQYINAVFYGYGLNPQLNQEKDGLRVQWVYESGNAAKMGLTRGSLITSVNGKTIKAAVADGTYESGEIWGPNEEGYTSSVSWIDINNFENTGEMSRSNVDTNTVMATESYTSNIGKVGYLVFNRFIQRSANDLNIAFNHFKQEQVSELVLDLRYNSGGYINIVKQLGSQIAGVNVTGKKMINYIYNNNNSNLNHDVAFELGEGKEQLNLSRVVILTTQSSASASEMLANSLAPYIDVKIIGSRSRGKPVGMSINKLCEHRIFAINFQTTNANDFGDYFDGLPVDCAAEDTVMFDWGDQRDPLLKEALYFIDNNKCSSVGVDLTRPKKQKFSNANPLKETRI